MKYWLASPWRLIWGVAFNLLTSITVIHAQSQALVDSLENEFAVATDTGDRLYWLNRLTWIHLVNHPEKARTYNDKAKSIAIESNDSLALAITQHYEGIAHRLTGDFKKAISRLNEALDTYQKVNHESGILGVQYNLSLAYDGLGDYQTSLDYLHRVYTANENNGDTLQMADALNSMASVHRKMGNYDKARQRYEESLDLIGESQHLWSITNALSNLGNLCLETNQLDDADRFIRAALKNSRLLKDDWGMSYDLFNLGRLLIAKDLPDSALLVLNESATLRKALELKTETAESLIEIGHVQSLRGAYQAANDAFFEAERLINETGALEPHIALRQAYYRHSVQQGDFSKAIIHLEQYWNLRDSAKSLARARSFDALELKYEFEKKNQQIAFNELELMKAKSEVQRQQQLLFGSLGGSLAIACIGFFMVRNLRTRRRLTLEKLNNLSQQRNVEDLKALMAGEEKERARIARELHDGIGAELAAVRLRFDQFQTQHLVSPSNGDYAMALKQLADVSSEVHRIAQNLMPELLIKYGLSTAISEFVGSINAIRNNQVKLFMIGLYERLPAEFELAVYRIVQELLSNVIKHSQANEVIVQVSQQEQLLSITVEDNGQGFDVTNAFQKSGLGLDNLRQRVRLFNGRLNIESQKNQGTSVFIEYDLNTLNRPI